MKNILFVVIINVIALGALTGQSKTMEIVPDFYNRNAEFISSEFQFEAAEESLEFIGLSCYHFDKESVDIFYRLKRDNDWSDWSEFSEQHEFVESNRSAFRTKPIQNSFSEIQFKTSEKLNTALTIRFFLAGREKSAHQIIGRSVNCDLPEICERVCWCPTCPVGDSPTLTEPTHLIVHHSAGNNESNNFATVVAFIWDLHVNTNGWDDIGYNWLIDPNGILYEGRSDNAQGAHFSCINENTVGICVIGDYSVEQPTEAALSSLVNLLAYEATDHLIDVNAQSYHVTGDFILENLAGHRDSSGSDNACSSTVCPGDSFYPLLEDIRLQVSELACYNIVSSTTQGNNMEYISVFPNPIHQHLYVISDKPGIQSLQIIDLCGRSLGDVRSGETNDLSHLQAGIYFLIYQGKLFEKIIKL